MVEGEEGDKRWIKSASCQGRQALKKETTALVVGLDGTYAKRTLPLDSLYRLYCLSKATKPPSMQHSGCFSAFRQANTISKYM